MKTKTGSSIRRGHAASAGHGCLHCVHFHNDPAFIEAAYPGLTAMSSGFASVRDQDGFCDLHQLYLSSRDNCPHFSPHSIRR